MLALPFLFFFQRVLRLSFSFFNKIAVIVTAHKNSTIQKWFPFWPWIALSEGTKQSFCFPLLIIRVLVYFQFLVTWQGKRPKLASFWSGRTACFKLLRRLLIWWDCASQVSSSIFADLVGPCISSFFVVCLLIWSDRASQGASTTFTDLLGLHISTCID